MKDSDSDTSAYFPKEDNLSGKKRELPDDCRFTYVPTEIVSEKPYDEVVYGKRDDDEKY